MSDISIVLELIILYIKKEIRNSLFFYCVSPGIIFTAIIAVFIFSKQLFLFFLLEHQFSHKNSSNLLV